MPIYHTMGQIPRKRHIAFRRPDGGLYAEELMGHEGFTGTSSLLYHTHPPTTVKSVRRLRETKYEADPDQTLRHRHFRTSQCSTSSPTRTTRTSTETPRPTSWCTWPRVPARSSRCSATCPTAKAIT